MVQDAVDSETRCCGGGLGARPQRILLRADRPVGVSPDAAILDQEIFGPVAPVVEFDSDDEAIGMANDTVHGLIAYVYTGDLAAACARQRPSSRGWSG